MKEKVTIRDIAERAGTSKNYSLFFLNGKANKMSEEAKEKTCKTHVVADDVTSDVLRDLLYNELPSSLSSTASYYREFIWH